MIGSTYTTALAFGWQINWVLLAFSKESNFFQALFGVETYLTTWHILPPIAICIVWCSREEDQGVCPWISGTDRYSKASQMYWHMVELGELGTHIQSFGS